MSKSNKKSQRKHFDCENKKIGFSSQSSPALVAGMFYPKQLKKTDTYYQEFLKTRKRIIYVAKLQKGKVIIYQLQNILTQTHKDILDIILSHIHKETETTYVAKVSKYTLLRSLQRHKNTKNYTWLTHKLQEITETFYVAEYITNNGSHESKPFTTMSFRYNSTTQSYTFEFNPKFIFLFFYLQKYSCQYTALLNKILRIKDVTVRAIARYCLTSYYVNINLFELLEKIGYGQIKTERTKRYVKKKVKDATKQLQELGISYNSTDNTISYTYKNTADSIKIYHRSLCALPNHSIKQTWEFIFS